MWQFHTDHTLVCFKPDAACSDINTESDYVSLSTVNKMLFESATNTMF